jgi:hypothetical protein
MNFEIIALIILFCSLIGMALIVWRKIPVLVQLPESVGKNQESLFLQIKKIITNINFFKKFSWYIFLQKVISKIRILTLKAENKTAQWLKELREKSQKQKNFENKNYWQELKKSTDNNKENEKDKRKSKPE